MSKKPVDRHHVVPRAKCRALGISPNFPGNVRKVKTTKHRAWHTLFGSQTPEEAIETIRREWSLSQEAQQTLTRLLADRIQCSRCKSWIHPGYEVYFRRQTFHSECAAQQAKVVTRKKRSRFRVIIGGQK